MNDQQQLIDRMVDGELTVEQQQALLFACEENDQWRGLALAYVEAQTWGGELKSLVRDSSSPWNAVANDLRNEGRNKDEDGRRRATRTSWRPLSLAAAILLSLTFGYGMGSWWHDRASELRSGVQELTAVMPGDEESSMRLTVSDPMFNELKQIELPIVSPSTLGDDWPMARAVPESVVDEMRRRGHEITQQRLFVPVRRSNGKRVLIPVDYVNFERGHRGFQ